jgi:hypothetical protein
MFCPFFHSQNEERNIRVYLEAIENEEFPIPSQQKGEYSADCFNNERCSSFAG